MPFNANDNSNNNQNDENKKTTQSSDQPISLAGSSNGGQNQTATNANSGRISNFSTGQQPSSGSGRFTNLQKYIGANQTSGDRLGAKIGENFNNKLNQDSTKVNEQNSQIAENINKGKEALNQGNDFKTQLTGIGNDLNSFQNMENRGNFDKAGQAAQAFTQSPNFNQFQNIQSGSAIDNDLLNNAQATALATGQGLNTYTQNQLNNIGNEAGRYNLIKDSFGNNRNYSSGNARFDQLFLQNAPNVVNNLKNQFNQGNISTKQMLNNIGIQGNNINDLLTNETNLINGINTQAQTNQDLFNTKLGSQSNIDFINKLRDDKYNEYLRQLQTGQISQGVAADLGLNSVYTYNPQATPAAGTIQLDPTKVSQKINVGGGTLPNSNIDARTLRTYNTDLANTAGSFLNKGRSAMNMQDIASQDDYNAYNALANIAKRDTGKLAGASTLDRAVTGKTDQYGNSILANTITNADKDFLNNYANKTAQATSIASESGPGDNSINPALGLQTGSVYQRVNPLTFGDASSLVNGGNYISQMRELNEKNEGSGAAGYAQANVNDYVLNPNSALLSAADKAWDNGGDTNSNNAARNNALNSARGAVQSYLDNIINQTGVRNTAQIVADDPNNIALAKAKRFGNLV